MNKIITSSLRWALETCASEPQTQSASFSHLKKKPKQDTAIQCHHTFAPEKRKMSWRKKESKSSSGLG